jgi:hypothetical protein
MNIHLGAMGLRISQFMRFTASFKSLALNIFLLGGLASGQSRSFAQDKAHLLDPHRERDAPLPIYKSVWEILQENWFLLTIFAGVALAVIFWMWSRRRLLKSEGNEQAPPRDPYEEAIEALKALDAQRKQLEAKPLTFRLSEVLRVYVERRFELPAMELTGEEFLREAAEHKFFRNHYDDLLKEFIDRSDMVKYSRESIDGEGLLLLMNSAKHFVRDTHRRFEEERLEHSGAA